MNKIAIALDILRQYNEYLETSGKETKIYSIDGYGERVSFKALVYGYWYTFSSIYGSNSSWYGYPKDMYWNKIWGDGIIGWNRPVTNPIIDIPKALTIYTQLNASASSYKDKFSRETAFKKLFYRDGSYANNVFIDDSIQTDSDGYIQTAGTVLQNEDPDFYTYVNGKLYDLYQLAANEAKNVSVPTKLKFLFDSKPVAKMYDAEPTDESYKDGLLNMNSSVIQANQFYLTFLTSFEQIIYQYTKQTFPVKLLGTLANLYSSYVKLITNYVKPYHARLIDKAPILRFGGGLEESIAVGDILRLDPTVQIYNDVVKWRFDNPYDIPPEDYDKLDKIYDEFYLGGKPDDSEQEEFTGIKYYEDIPESGIVYKLEDKDHTYHRIDDVKIYTDNKLHRNNIFEDITITSDEVHSGVYPKYDNIPFDLYPSAFYNKYKIEDVLEYNWLNNYIENITDRDLCIVTNLYTRKDQYRISNIKFKHKDYDIDISSSRIGVFAEDINTLYVYKKNINNEFMWNRVKIPKIADIFNRIDPPARLAIPCSTLGLNKDLLDTVEMPNKFYNFIKFFLYIPAHSKAILPEIEYTCRTKI